MRPSLFKIIICAAFCLLAKEALLAQGWRRTYDSGQNNIAHTLLHTQDGGLLMVGSKLIKTNASGDVEWTAQFPANLYGMSTNGSKQAEELPDGSFIVVYSPISFHSVILARYNNSGQLEWSKQFDYGTWAIPSAIAATQDGGYIISINCDYGSQSECARIVKTDAVGNIDWQKEYDITQDSVKSIQSVVPLSSGGYAICGVHAPYTNLGPFVAKLDNNGDVEWRKNWTAPSDNFAYRILETPQNEIVVVGNWYSPTNNSSLFVAKLEMDGNELWFNIYNELSPFYCHDGVILSNEEIVLVGTFDLYTPGSQTGVILKINGDGAKIWQQNYDDYDHAEYFHSIVRMPDGGFAISGAEVDLNYHYDALLIKTDSLGNLFSHTLYGNVFHDLNLDCQLIAEPGLQNFIIKAEGVDTYYTQSDSLGNYEILMDTGSYEVSVVPMNYWEPCNLTYPINTVTLYDSTRLDLPMQGAINCSLMTVEISTPFLRQCNQGYYAVSYCNYGVVPAVGATVEITLDPEIHFSSATAPLISQNGQVLLFDLDNVGSFDCEYFNIYFSIDCNLALVGQTLCLQAHIYPDSICGDNWTGPNLEVTGICESDSVQFTITNSGGDMPQPQAYIVIEDNIILMTDDVQLLENQTFQISLEAQDGATYHLLASQDPNMPPIYGNQFATSSIEGCSGNVTPAAFNQFPQDDGEPWLDIDCHEVIASFDPNDKTSFPTGWLDEHLIDESTQLDYLIRFQNTGTDTAFRVVLIDTLSSFLDPGTIRPGASSHPYKFELSGQGVAKFIFEDILLPDSNVNEALSHGFVQFHIAQQPDNQPGTLIENTAGIYFDYNAPVYTNTTFHTIHVPWVRMVLGSVESLQDRLTVKISPNPMGDWALIEVGNLTPGENTLTILDAMGREVIRQPFSQDKTVIERSSLTSGVYFFKVENGGGLVATGKLVVR